MTIHIWPAHRLRLIDVVLWCVCLQVPSWLNLTHPRVTLVPHSSIFSNPEQQLPTFNSNAIQACLHNIPGLCVQQS